MVPSFAQIGNGSVRYGLCQQQLVVIRLMIIRHKRELVIARGQDVRQATFGERPKHRHRFMAERNGAWTAVDENCQGGAFVLEHVMQYRNIEVARAYELGECFRFRGREHSRRIVRPERIEKLTKT